MKPLDPALLTASVYKGAGADAAFVRQKREGFDPATIRQLESLLAIRAAAPLAHRLGIRRLRRQPLTYQGLVEAIGELSEPETGLRHNELDIVAVLAEVLRSQEPEGALGRAWMGLLIIAALEGLAKRNRPRAEYPFLSVSTIEQVCLPVARLLIAAGGYSAAGTLAMMLRHYMTCDPYQRTMESGRQAIADCRAIEAQEAQRLREQCRETAWRLREAAAADVIARASVATLFFAVGDVLRARAIVTRGHVPALHVFVDLVEVCSELIPVDRLLQVVWFASLTTIHIEPPDDLNWRLRLTSREINSQFKATDKVFEDIRGMPISAAYATGIFNYVAGFGGPDVVEATWWKVLTESLMHVITDEYPSGLVRLIEVFSLATEPGTPLPMSGHISGMAGNDPHDLSDMREVATLSLRGDQWTTRRGQVGRSLAYDSSFLIEPWRRAETAEGSLHLLEQHRCAGLRYWLAVIPPLSRPSVYPERQDLVTEDKKLMQEFRSLAFLATVREAPLYLRAYGFPQVSRIIRISEGERIQRLIDCDRRRKEWYEKTREIWPEYADSRLPYAVNLEEISYLIEEE
jgi:hypothetical protein